MSVAWMLSDILILMRPITVCNTFSLCVLILCQFSLRHVLVPGRVLIIAQCGTPESSSLARVAVQSTMSGGDIHIPVVNMENVLFSNFWITYLWEIGEQHIFSSLQR